MALWRIALVSIKWIVWEVEREILWVMSISLEKAKEDGLLELKAYGWMKQTNLPLGYTQQQYISMTEGSCIRIEDLPISAGYRVEFDFQTTTLNSALRNYIGGRANWVSAGWGFRLSKLASSGTGLNRVVLYGFETGTEYYDPTAAFQANTRYKYTYDNGVCTLESGGSVVSTNTFTVTDNNSTDWWINDYYSNGSYSAYHDPIYVYSVKVWDDQGELVMNLIPAKTSTEIGLYDTVTDTLRTASIGTFEAGWDTTPTPTAPMDIVCNNWKIWLVDTELPSAYRRLQDIIFDWDIYYATNTYLTGADTTSFIINIGESGRNALGCYTWSADWNNLSLYIALGSAWCYARYKDTLYRPVISTNKLNTDLSLAFTPTWTTGFDTDATWTQLTFTCPDPLYIGWLPNATSAKFVGAFKWNLTVSDRAKFIPCERVSDWVIGYYELESWTFLTPQWTWTPTTTGYDFTYCAIGTTGTTETLEVDTTSDTATAEILLWNGLVFDEQEVISWDVTRKFGFTILNWSETRSSTSSSSANNYRVFSTTLDNANEDADWTVQRWLCTHFYRYSDENWTAPSYTWTPEYRCWKLRSSKTFRLVFPYNTDITSGNLLKAWLKSLYDAWTPVILYYPLETTTTESVAAQPMSIDAGTNTIDITQASLDDLELSAKYKALP